MKIITSLDALRETPPHAFTIGTFDGVHKGHKALFAKLKKTNQPMAILTFSTHPLHTLCPEKSPSLITALEVKLALLAQEGFASAVVLPFSSEIANLSFRQFLEKLPLSHLILGKDAAFGKRREGNEKQVQSWAIEKEIPVEYIEKMKLGTEPISSRQIRDAIKRGNLPFAESLLGRPHLLSVSTNTTCFSLSGLCLPPDGEYPLSQGIRAILSTTDDGRWIELSKSFSEKTLVSFNPAINISLRGIYV